MNDVANETGALKEAKNVNLVQSIIRFDCNEYNEEEDADYKPDPEVEEEIIQEYQNEAEHLVADEVYHDFVENINVDLSQNVDNLEDTNDDTEFIVEADPDEDEHHGKQQQNEGENFVDCDSTAYDSTCTETDLEDEQVKAQIDDEEIKLLAQQVAVKVPKSSLQANQAVYPPFWRVKHALQNVDSEKEADSETDPDYFPIPSNDTNNGEYEGQEDIPQTEVEKRNLQLRHRIVQFKGTDLSDSSDDCSASEEEDEEEDKELENEMGNLKELENLSDQVKGMVEMVEEMSFVDGEQDNEVDARKGGNILGVSNYFQNINTSQPSSIVDAIAKFDEQNYQEDDDADYLPDEDKENEICMQE
jgi:hypothetical protein